MSLFTDFENVVITGAKKLAATTFQGLFVEAENDAKNFLQMAKADLQQWTSQLATNQIGKDDFTDLVQGDADLAKLDALTAAGLFAADVQRFRDGLINLVIDAAFKTFLP